MRVALNTCTIYAFLDPAGKKRGADQLKKVRANSAIIALAVEPTAEPRIFVLEAWASKAPASAVMEKVFEINERWHPKVFGVEANAMQELYAQMVIMEAQKRALQIHLAEVYQPTNVEKHWRIRTRLNPYTNYGRVFLLDSQTELFNELTVFPMSPIVDLVDALASAASMIPPRPKPPAEVDDDANELARYLRLKGVRPDLIEQRVREYASARAAAPARSPS